MPAKDPSPMLEEALEGFEQRGHALSDRLRAEFGETVSLFMLVCGIQRIVATMLQEIDQLPSAEEQKAALIAWTEEVERHGTGFHPPLHEMLFLANCAAATVVGVLDAMRRNGQL